MPEDTIFSKIVRGEAPADIVYRDDQVTAFRDIQPQSLIKPSPPSTTLRRMMRRCWAISLWSQPSWHRKKVSTKMVIGSSLIAIAMEVRLCSIFTCIYWGAQRFFRIHLLVESFQFDFYLLYPR